MNAPRLRAIELADCERLCELLHELAVSTGLPGQVISKASQLQQAAFSDKVCIDEARITQGEWCAAFGRQEAVHSGEFMGIAPTGKRVEIRYMDFWKVVDGEIVDNWVMVDFPSVMQQLGVDPFNGQGWERFDTPS